ncbi:hypothetical protein COOONC_24144 [Cooperia oncophora]
MINAESGSHPITLHRALKTEEQDDYKTATISALRRKFEISTQRRPSYSSRYERVSTN